MSYKLLISDEYKKKLKKFFKKHPNMLDRYSKCLFVLEQDPYHPSLRIHKLKGQLAEFYSISINMEYRIIIDFIIRDGEIILVDIGTHDDVY
ncbi:type II toxin-antitoxin system mRNA interferase toxin, RelE/StbE family [Poseidonibacter lekithochrous]|uniref:type II toxin-antitoxin system RelE/ParE family toxin n=1 Tax=Poseidonibacter TaxID=2321187 RepID=UPI001C091BE2|nr:MULTISPECIES: type II toxin-antitoxin system mRNA interferase toxin, RelE/StbE family [Poseidonibacter]MBU3015290.1 type II toxin-antitoxin system mRNA interferase toxin, RelE/StbE family [Poseidonibacter lekithochrous]MDO6828588.1 type II toxin-antitoxin system mRNA interferase toxin, RelE/StbE family [Poseidonibacter sp. 1_MG-2023]